MTAVRTADRGNVSSMAGGRKPVVHGGANTPTLDGRIAWAVMTGDQQQDAVAARDRLLQTPVDCSPGDIEVHAVEVEHAVGLNCPAPQSLVPAAVEGLLADWNARPFSGRTRLRR